MFYMDDSGTKEYSADGLYPAQKGKTPFFVFAGILVNQAEAGRLPDALRDLKRAHFGRPDVEIKANWLRIDYERKDRYLDPFGLTEERLRRFCDEVYGLIATSKSELIGCVVNKAEVQALYGSRAWYAPAIAYECLLQRVQSAMVSCSGSAHVTIDDMMGATPKGSPYRQNLQKHHRGLVDRGGNLIRKFSFDRVVGQSFSDSAADERLQLADLVAYAIYRQFIEHGPDWEDASKDAVPVYPYLHRIIQRFRHQGGRVQGYGIAKFPLKVRVPWTRNEKP